MVPCGLEPRTLRLLAVRSDQLSYKSEQGNSFAMHPKRHRNGQKEKRHLWGSNPRVQSTPA